MSNLITELNYAVTAAEHTLIRRVSEAEGNIRKTERTKIRTESLVERWMIRTERWASRVFTFLSCS